MFSLDLTDKNALLVGSSGNLGPIWLETLKEAGATVYEFDYPEHDVRHVHSINHARDEMLSKIGVPDIIIYNAGIDSPPGSGGSFWGNDEIINVNYLGAKRVCQAFWKVMQVKGGQILFIGSMYARVSADENLYPGSQDKPVDYGASKAALVVLCKNLATRGGKFGIRCNVLSLAGVDGDQDEDFKRRYLRKVPLGRMASKEDCKKMLIGILMIGYLNGYELLVDGGYTAW